VAEWLPDLLVRAAAFLIATRCLLWPAFVVSLGTTTLIATRMRRLEHDTDLTPLPSPAVLLAVSRVGRAEALMRRWKKVGCERVRAQVYSDFGLIPAYAAAGIFGSLLAASALPSSTLPASVQRVAVGCGLGALWLGAGVVDAIENGLLLLVLPPKSHSRWQHVALAVGSCKWALVILARLGMFGTLVRGISLRL
jgi:hypothetical protein